MPILIDIAVKDGKAVYKTNDHWFKLDVKFVWKEALKQAEDSG